jgi:hypothetical protein
VLGPAASGRAPADCDRGLRQGGGPRFSSVRWPLSFLPEVVIGGAWFVRDLARDGWKLVSLLLLSRIMPFSATSLALGLYPSGQRDDTRGTLASLPALCVT